MATPALTGTPLSLALDVSTATPSTIDVTIPSDATGVIIALQWYHAATELTGLTLEGVAPDSGIVGYVGPNNDATAAGGAWFTGSFTTGANQTISITWDAAPNTNDGPCGAIWFIKDCDITGCRDIAADGEGSTSAVSVTVGSEITDIIWKFDGRSDPGVGYPGLSAGYTSDLTGDNGGSFFRLSHIAGSATSTVVDAEDENYTGMIAFVVKESDGSVTMPADSFTVTTSFTDAALTVPKASEGANSWYNGEWYPSPWHKTPWYAATDAIVMDAEAFTLTTSFTDITTEIDVPVTVMDAEAFTLDTTFTDAKLYVPFPAEAFTLTTAFTDVTFAIEYTSPEFIISCPSDETFDGRGIEYGIDVCLNQDTGVGYTALARVDVDSIFLDGIFGTAPQNFSVQKYVGEITTKSKVEVEFDGTNWHIVSITNLGL